ncbi:MAG TPA: hypothetical protein VIM11_23695 [Tepidisphaeraceae bacterium]
MSRVISSIIVAPRRGGAGAMALVFVLCGCGSSNQPTAVDRQDKALKDPFGYSPDLKNSDMSVSGHGDTTHQELKRDFDHVINP